MGIDPHELSNEQLERLGPADRQVVAERIGHPNAGLTTDEALAKHLRRLEREEQNTLVNWLLLQEEAGKLTVDWSRTDRKTTNRKGMPDFRIYRDGRVLLGEMKMDGAKLSPDQEAMREKFLRSGTEVQIWSSAEAGIRATRNWLWTHWRMWHEGPTDDIGHELRDKNANPVLSGSSAFALEIAALKEGELERRLGHLEEALQRQDNAIIELKALLTRAADALALWTQNDVVARPLIDLLKEAAK